MKTPMIKLKVNQHYLLNDGSVVKVMGYDAKTKFPFYGKPIGRGNKSMMRWDENGKYQWHSINHESDIASKYIEHNEEWWKFLKKGERFTVDGQIKTLKKVKVILVSEEDKTGFNIDFCVPYSPNINMVISNIRKGKLSPEKAIELIGTIKKEKGGLI